MNLTKTNLCLLVLAASTVGTILARADNKPTNSNKLTNSVPNIRSVFVVPKNTQEGRDPFFPESTRLVDVSTPTNRTPEITSLTVPGISGTPDHLLAIINNHTFAVGDEGDVLTTTGRIHLRCVEIQTNAVVVEVGGQIHRIKLEKLQQ
jgi:hypothetical protein